jgi:hypothetical protein
MSDNVVSTAGIVLAAFFLVIVLLVGAWDIYASSKGNAGQTVSDVMFGWAKMYPIMPLTIGVILGHLFWR